eukprot:CAMPEP_0114626788 /NCGR_PEP_ID=MMETSP0168-20121206/11964_1 /TAXON_ID=95228 ORGANISM="Vannella sp., Strain DIVA3 517/6/12" /NCGR_SAMPLE_ID=MMETSP0168 /ASSEMBLY_ACC=CAM_ASM_000044 /LENGTH=355 /DNA_ID=CAMNT_0001838107 /DNA_START=6 /DNA_END=1070 /DNA_ORIENTATION=+
MSSCGGKPCDKTAGDASVTESVQDYYGRVLETTKDLKTSACSGPKPPKYIRSVLAKINDEVMAKYFGCGITIPQDTLVGLRVLDLGSGSGQDVFVASALIGEEGECVGVDMTDEQLAIANKYVEFHRKAFGHAQSNVRFVKGYIEKLDEAGIEDSAYDMIISNCVINLSPDKESVLRQAYRVLKEGGELYFSDIYSDRRVPNALKQDSVLFGEGLSGSLYWKDFLQLAKSAGFADPRLVESRELQIYNEEIKTKVGNIRYFSATYRLFKIAELEQSREDFGHAVIYKGTLPYCPSAFRLDSEHLLQRGKVYSVCKNTYLMLKRTRLESHFHFINCDSTTHFGTYSSCGSGLPFKE